MVLSEAKFTNNRSTCNSSSWSINEWADFWRYKIGSNDIPADTKNKTPLVEWKQYQNKPIPDEIHNQWKRENAFSKGIAIITGKVWHNPDKKGLFLDFIDLDNKRALEDFCTRKELTTSLTELAKSMIIEQHKDEPNKAHAYCYSTHPFKKKSSDRVSDLSDKIDANEIPAIEIKGAGEHGLAFVTPSVHKNGHNYEIIGTLEPETLDVLELHLDSIFRKHGLSYLDDSGKGSRQQSLIPIEKLFEQGTKILKGHNRHEALLRAMESLIQRNITILQPNDIKIMARLWHNRFCSPPLEEKEFERQWKDAVKFIGIKNQGQVQEQNNEINAEPERILEVSESCRLFSGWHKVRGTTSSISQLYVMVKSAELKCSACNKLEVKDFGNPISFAQYEKFKEKENSCSENGCKGNFSITNPKYVNAITMELTDSNSLDNLDKQSFILFDDNTKNVTIGESVIIYGKSDVIHNSKYGKGFSVIYADSIIYQGRQEVNLTESDIEEIKSFRHDHGANVVKELAKLMAPKVMGHYNVKEGLLLSAVNTREDDPDNRERMHVLIIGPPGLAKTTLLRQSAKLVPKSSVENAPTSSGLSLIAIIDKEENNSRILRLGAIPKARGAICGIDEINRMISQHQEKLLGVMEQGLTTENKYGINVTIRAPTTIIATANPIEFDSDNKIDLNKLLIIPPLVDRFDLKFIIKKIEGEENNRNFAYTILGQDSEEIPDHSVFLQKYIIYSKQFEPKISDDTIHILAEYYPKLTRIESMNATPRVLKLLKNLTLARARLKFKNIADAEDAIESLEFYKENITDYHEQTVLPEIPMETAYRLCLDILKDLTSGKSEGLSLQELINIVCNKNEQVKRYLYFGSKSLHMRDNRKVRNLYESLLENNKNHIRRISYNPTVLQWFEFESVPCDTCDVVTEPSIMKSTNSGVDSIENNNIIQNNVCHTVTSVTSESINSDFPPKCYRCEFSNYNSKKEYDIHCVTKHPRKAGYPGLVDIEKDGLKPQNMRWEI